MRDWKYPVAAAVVGLVIAASVWLLDKSMNHSVQLAVVSANPAGVMGTSCLIVAVVPANGVALGNAAVEAAELEVRRVEALMSGYLDDSEISRLNNASAGIVTLLSGQTLEVLKRARRVAEESGGVFDVTCSPLVGLWREAEKEGRLPERSAVAEARDTSGWSHFELLPSGVRKGKATAQIDLGGIAKGWAIDRAIEVLEQFGCVGGLVDIGGDLRVFGTPAALSRWPVEIRDPFYPGTWKTIYVEGSAVCTSGDYARFLEIEGRRFSHIIDPRSGYPVRDCHSVTVLAPTATAADAWATALCVLGPEGLALLPRDRGFAAVLVIGNADRPEISMTEGFEKYFTPSPP